MNCHGVVNQIRKTITFEHIPATNPVSREKYENSGFSFYQNVKQEGILL